MMNLPAQLYPSTSVNTYSSVTRLSTDIWASVPVPAHAPMASVMTMPTALNSSRWPSYKTKLIRKELCTVFLDSGGASDDRSDLAKTLYSLLFTWLNEHINQHLCRDDSDTF